MFEVKFPNSEQVSPVSRKKFFQNLQKNKGVIIPSENVMDKAMELSMPLFTIEETIIKPKTNQYEAEKKGPTDSLIDNGTWNGLLPLYQ